MGHMRFLRITTTTLTYTPRMVSVDGLLSNTLGSLSLIRILIFIFFFSPSATAAAVAAFAFWYVV